MRHELSEPQHWRSQSASNLSWGETRRAPRRPMPAELVDAAFDEEGLRLDAAEAGTHEARQADGTSYPELVACLNEQLSQLEAHRQQIQQLLAQANGR